MKSLSIVVSILWICVTSAQAPTIGEKFGHNQLLIEKSQPAASVIKAGVPRILDFFASGCMVCFKTLPKIKQMQERFGGEMQFIMVGLEDGSIRKTYKRFEQRHSLSFPTVFDSFLPAKLGISFYPHYIWIDGKNIVQAITGPDEVNEENIQKFLRGSVVTTSTAVQIPFDPQKLLLDSNNGGDITTLRFRSLLSEYKNGQTIWLPPSVNSIESPNKFQALGAKMTLLYRYAYLGSARWDSNDSIYRHVYPHLVIDAQDSTQQIRADLDKSFCYSIVTKSEAFSTSELQRVMKNDLENYFGYEAFVIDRLMPYWSLKLTDESVRTQLLSKGGRLSEEMRADGLKIANAPVSELIRMLAGRNPLEPPFIDDTGIQHNIDLSLDAILFDLDELQVRLLEKGLKLERDFRMMKIILLKPKVDYVNR